MRFEASTLPINAGRYRRGHQVPGGGPRSGAFNAECRKPVAHRAELAEKSHQAVKGP